MPKAPKHRWRTLPSHGNHAYADDEATIREKAKEQAQKLGTWVGYELWSEDHPQDELNQGWALVGKVDYVRPEPTHEDREAQAAYDDFWRL